MQLEGRSREGIVASGLAAWLAQAHVQQIAAAHAHGEVDFVTLDQMPFGMQPPGVHPAVGEADAARIGLDVVQVRGVNRRHRRAYATRCCALQVRGCFSAEAAERAAERAEATAEHAELWVWRRGGSRRSRPGDEPLCFASFRLLGLYIADLGPFALPFRIDRGAPRPVLQVQLTHRRRQSEHMARHEGASTHCKNDPSVALALQLRELVDEHGFGIYAISNDGSLDLGEQTVLIDFTTKTVTDNVSVDFDKFVAAYSNKVLAEQGLG